MSHSSLQRFVAAFMVVSMLAGGVMPLLQHVCAQMLGGEHIECYCPHDHAENSSEDCEHQHDGDEQQKDGVAIQGGECDLTLQQANVDAVLSQRYIQLDVPVVLKPLAMQWEEAPIASATVSHVSDRAPPQSAVHDLHLLNEVFLN